MSSVRGAIVSPAPLIATAIRSKLWETSRPDATHDHEIDPHYTLQGRWVCNTCKVPIRVTKETE